MVPGERDWSIEAVQMAGMPATAAALRASPGPRAAVSPGPRAAASPGPRTRPRPGPPRVTVCPPRGRTLGRSCRRLSRPTSPSRLGGAPKATRRHIAPRPRSRRLNSGCHCGCLSCFRPSTRDSANKPLEVPVILVVLIEYILKCVKRHGHTVHHSVSLNYSLLSR
jgi:hypothetical protein